MNVSTIQLARWRILKGSKFTIHDSTVKTGTSLFAPTWDMVAGIKSGTLSHESYVNQYRALIKARFSSNKEWFSELLTEENIAIACTCASGEFCHRYLVIDALRALCKSKGIPFEYVGELFNERQF